MNIKYYGYCEYIGDCKLYTAVMLPYEGGKFPVVIKRTPYAKSTIGQDDDKVLLCYMNDNEKWLIIC